MQSAFIKNSEIFDQETDLKAKIKLVQNEKLQFPKKINSPQENTSNKFSGQNEPILTENPNRFVLFPIKYSQIWEMYKKHMASFWTADEIDLEQDKRDWEKLSKNEKHFIKYVLAFFAASDGIVLENLAGQFCTEVQIPEARCFYGFQIAMENIHSETYSLLIDTLFYIYFCVFFLNNVFSINFFF